MLFNQQDSPKMTEQQKILTSEKEINFRNLRRNYIFKIAR